MPEDFWTQDFLNEVRAEYAANRELESLLDDESWVPTEDDLLRFRTLGTLRDLQDQARDRFDSQFAAGGPV